jgi:hypothetical protein
MIWLLPPPRSPSASCLSFSVSHVSPVEPKSKGVGEEPIRTKVARKPGPLEIILYPLPVYKPQIYTAKNKLAISFLLALFYLFSVPQQMIYFDKFL